MTDNIAPRLAAGLLDGSGIACIHLTIQPAKDQHSRVVIGDVAAFKEPGVRIWLKSRTVAERVVTEFFSSCKQAKRHHAGGLVVGADIDTIEPMIREFAQRLGHRPIDADALMWLLIQRTESTLEAMKRDGKMKALNKAYAAARSAAKANGTPAPARYDHWLVERVKPLLPAFSILVDRVRCEQI